MPTRMLRESIITSENLTRVSREAECLFYRILVTADDFGLFPADPETIKSRCFPTLIRHFQVKKIRKMLKELTDSDLIIKNEDQYGVTWGLVIGASQYFKRRSKRPKFKIAAKLFEEYLQLGGGYVEHAAGRDAPQDADTVQGGMPSLTETVVKTGTETDGGKPATLVREVFDHYRKHHPRSHPKPKSTSKEWKLIRDRLSEGHSVEDLKQAIDGCHVTPHNCGQNERNQQYQSLALIVRDGSQVARFIDAWAAHEAKKDKDSWV